jgi:hypothetical protein
MLAIVSVCDGMANGGHFVKCPMMIPAHQKNATTPIPINGNSLAMLRLDPQCVEKLAFQNAEIGTVIMGKSLDHLVDGVL